MLAQVLDDLHDSFPAQIDRAARLLALSTTKAERYLGEMREAATQASVGLTPALFEAMAEVYADLARTPLASEPPESIAREPRLEDILDEIKPPDPSDSEPGSAATLQRSKARRPGRSASRPSCAESECGREDLNLQEPKPTGT